ncbi:putative phage tail protein [uncultured Anaerococcus sp.]|uniref:putative phage tail protein n=1 Tax=uncultured Anaerococcus sp. TaxID=293428 RepID=UPI0028040AE3|nr:putative phage tail protein [uncultured Anaerococcus sp.]
MFYDYKDAMVDYLPWYDKENEIIVNVCRCLELAFRDLDKKYDFIYSNLFLDTAVDMLPLFMKKLGLKVSDGASIEDKRNLIQAYMHYLHQQTTEKIVAEMVEGTINGDVEAEISRDKEVDVFNLDIKVRSLVNNNLDDVEKMLRKILPSHLWIKTQVAVLTDIKFSVASISGEEIVISQPALDDLIIDRPFTVRASNAGSFEYIEISGQEE